MPNPLILSRDEIQEYLAGTTMDLDESDLCASHEALRARVDELERENERLQTQLREYAEALRGHG